MKKCKKRILAIFFALTLLFSLPNNIYASETSTNTLNMLSYFGPYGKSNIYGNGELKPLLLPLNSDIDAKIMKESVENIKDFSNFTTSKFEPDRYGDQMIAIDYQDDKGYNYTDYVLVTTVLDIENPTMSEIYTPKINDVKAFKGADIRIEDFLNDTDKLPEGTEFTYPILEGEKLDTNTPGSYEVIIRANYPDNSYEDFKVVLRIDEEVNDISRENTFYALTQGDNLTESQIEKLKEEAKAKRDSLNVGGADLSTNGNNNDGGSKRAVSDGYLFAIKKDEIEVFEDSQLNIYDFFENSEDIPADYELSFKTEPDTTTLGRNRATIVAVSKDEKGEILDEQHLDVVYTVISKDVKKSVDGDTKSESKHGMDKLLIIALILLFLAVVAALIFIIYLRVNQSDRLKESDEDVDLLYEDDDDFDD